MKIGVMQPYFLPYVGYFQLINCVDQFVFFDDVNFIKKGWINRNQIIVNQEASLFSIPLKKASQNKKINEIEIATDENWIKSFRKKIEDSYAKAPYFNQGIAIIDKLFCSEIYRDDLFISDLAINSINEVLSYLEISKDIVLSSQLDYEHEGNGESKIISICKSLNADAYVNPYNGKHLYSDVNFLSAGVNLSFIKMAKEISYDQQLNHTIANLSILDVIMFNSPDEIKKYLNEFILVKD